MTSCVVKYMKNMTASHFKHRFNEIVHILLQYLFYAPRYGLEPKWYFGTFIEMVPLDGTWYLEMVPVVPNRIMMDP